MKRIAEIAPGMLVCIAIAAAATMLVKLVSALEIVGAPVFGILIGIALGTFTKVSKAEKLKTGISYTSKKILQAAVVLLGFGLNLATVGKVGMTSLPIIISTIATSLIVAYIVFRLFKVPSKVATLIGVGSSICGGSAIAATAPVIKADDEEIAQSISVVFLFNVVAALIFPTLGDAIGLTDAGFGLFAGTAINDTSSVTAASSVWDTLHGTGGRVLEYATIVKLTRTLAIIPITLVLALIQAKKKKTEDKTGNSFSLKSVFPMFILWFIVASIITTVCISLGVEASVFSPLKDLSKFFIIMAMAAIGLGTNVVKLIKNGGKPILLGACCWAGVTGVSLVMQHLLHLW